MHTQKCETLTVMMAPSSCITNSLLNLCVDLIFVFVEYINRMFANKIKKKLNRLSAFAYRFIRILFVTAQKTKRYTG